MYNKIINDISQQYYKENYPNDGQRFVAWYLRNIHNLDTIEAKDCQKIALLMEQVISR